MELTSPTEFAKQKVLSVQEYIFLSLRSLANLFKRPSYMGDMLQQADLIGVGSISIVLSACFFIGVALALNSAITLGQFGARSLIGELVSIGVIRELGPLLAGLVVAGRNASGMASELGSMVVTEQIDAMRALGTDPMKKLVTPRVVSTVVMLTFLTIVANFVGTFGGAAVSVFMNGQNGTQYFNYAYQALTYRDLIQGLGKPLFFGFIISTVGCFFGMKTSGGTQGVGRATTQAVVVASVMLIF